MLLQTDCFHAHLAFSFCLLFLYHELQKYFVFVAKVQEKIANHAECGCASLIDKVLEVNALNDFFSHSSLIILMYNIAQWCHLTTYKP